MDARVLDARFNESLSGDRFADPFPGCSADKKAGILIVDDEALVVDLLKSALGSYGFRVWPAGDGPAALAIYARERRAIDLVLLDVRMPGMDGPETLAALQEINPDVRCCFITGDSGAYPEAELLRRGALCVLHKPFRLGELVALLERLTAKGAALASGG